MLTGTMKNFDLKLLAVLNDLRHTRSVSKTAENLGLSQSAVSMSLAKLRKHFGDPLFVRTSNGMEPTTQAAEMIQLLQRAEDFLQMALQRDAAFDPQHSDRVFRLYSTDIAQVALMPKLTQRLGEVAPSVRVDLRWNSDSTPRLLETGDADVAIGLTLPMSAGFCRRSLFREKLVCAVRRNHPRIGNRLSMDELQNEAHLAAAIVGAGHGALDRALASKGIHRRVALIMPTLLGIESVLASTDCVAILPGKLAEYVARHENIKILDLPFPSPSYAVVLHWHGRYTHDPALRWLRNLIAELFSEQHDLSQENSSCASVSPHTVTNSSDEVGETLAAP
jgi:DNA-binding transcriptional LysR family regulator